MLQHRRQFRYIYQFIDSLLIVLSFYLAFKIRNMLPFFTPSMVTLREYFLVSVFWAMVLIFMLHAHNLYATDRDISFAAEVFKIGKVVFISAIAATLFIFSFHITGFSRLLFGIVLVFMFILLSVWRIIKRAMIRKLILKGRLSLNVLIVGAKEAGKAILNEINNNSYLGLNVVGFLDDGTGSSQGLKVLGRISDFDRIVHEYFIDEVYLTELASLEKASDLIFQARKLNKTVKIFLHNLEPFFGKISLGYIGSMPLIKYFESDLYGTGGLVKRIFDIVISSVLLVLLSPFFLLIVLLIKLDTSGSVIYVSQRSGKRNKIFNFYKFRTMVKDADCHKESLRHKSQVTGPIFKIKNDPRITRVGAFLRKFSLDELPQLVNVLKGDMSLVGPRPPTPDEVVKYDFWQMRRLSITPGLTGLWQVRGRSDSSFYKLVKWDLWYINNWSLLLDIKILLWTLPVAIRGKGAY